MQALSNIIDYIDDDCSCHIWSVHRKQNLLEKVAQLGILLLNEITLFLLARPWKTYIGFSIRRYMVKDIMLHLTNMTFHVLPNPGHVVYDNIFLTFLIFGQHHFKFVIIQSPHCLSVPLSLWLRSNYPVNQLLSLFYRNTSLSPCSKIN